MNIREAILKAADSIEQNPGLFNFSSIRVPDFDCGTPGCAIGWMAYHLGLGEWAEGDQGDGLYWILDRSYALKEIMDQQTFYNTMDNLSEGWRIDAKSCAVGLRLYANKYYAEEPKTEKFKGIPVWCREIFEGESA